MKKIIYILITLLPLVGLAKTVTITGQGCNIRQKPDKTAIVVGQVKAGETYDVQEEFGYYVEVEVVQGVDKKSTSDHVGKRGYIWVERLSSIQPGESFIIKEGCCLRSSPNKLEDNIVAKVKVGATMKITKLVSA